MAARANRFCKLVAARVMFWGPGKKARSRNLNPIAPKARTPRQKDPMLDSVRFRLTLWYTLALALIVVVLCVVSYFSYWRSTLERADGNLAELSDAFVATFQAELGNQGDIYSIKDAGRVAILEHRFRDHIFAVLDPAN